MQIRLKYKLIILKIMNAHYYINNPCMWIKLLSWSFQASYSFNNSSKIGFVDIDPYIVINHMVHLWSIIHVSISNNDLRMNFLSNKWIVSYSFNNSNEINFVNIDHYIVINHMVHYTCLSFKKMPTNEIS